MMSINDNDFDEVRDERESKSFRVIRGCFKGLLYGASALVWILVLYTVFSTRESKLLDKMIFTDATQKLASENEEYQVYQFNTIDFMNQDGSITISSIWYSPESGELELGVKYNKKLTDSQTGDLILYVLKDENGNEYPVVHLEEDEIGRYGYARVCFSGVSLQLAQSEWHEDREEESQGENKHPVLTLTMYRRSDGELLSTYIETTVNENGEKVREVVNNSDFVIFDADTVYRKVDFEN